MGEETPPFYSMYIKRANHQPAMKAAGGIQKFVEQIIMSNWGGLPNIDWDNPEGDAFAYILRSGWVVGCPFCEETLFAEPYSTFFCPSCLMGDNGGKVVQVYFPKNWQHIEDTLMQRLNPLNRNWLLHESVEDLLLENEVHGA